jgi:hypothetical protein
VPKIINIKGRHLIVPPGAVYVGHGMYGKLPWSKWANRFKPGRDGTRAEVIAKYRAYLLARPDLMAALPELHGKDLACWCVPQACHAEVLLELANLTKPQKHSLRVPWEDWQRAEQLAAATGYSLKACDVLHGAIRRGLAALKKDRELRNELSNDLD